MKVLGARHELRLAQRHVSPLRKDVIPLDLAGDFDLLNALRGVDVVIHSAGLAHQSDKENNASRALYFKVNAKSTERIALSALEAGVKHFIFLSTVKVNGEGGHGVGPYRSSDEVKPFGAYAESKAEAEKLLLSIAHGSRMTISILRPPLIYGPGVKANFARLLRMSSLMFLAPHSIRAGKRSLVSIWNLSGLIEVLVDERPKNSGIYMVSDGSDCTTFELLEFIAAAKKRKILRFPIPLLAVRNLFRAVGKIDTYEKLFGSLRVDLNETMDALNWEPTHNTEEGIRKLLEYRS